MKKVKENVREFDGVYIPKSILDSRELSPMLKFLLIEIKCLDNDAGCYASNAHLAERIASSSNSVSNMIAELAKKSFIYVSYKDEKAFSGRIINVNQIKFYGIDPNLPQNTPTRKMEGGTRKVEGHTLKMEGGTRKVEHRSTLEIDLEKKVESLPEPAKNETPLTVNAIVPKTEVTAATSFENKTNYRLIDTPEELTDVTEQVIIKYAESLKKDFERRGFVATNARDYAIEFANQFFKTFKMCSLKDEAIKRKLAEWAFIFAKVNTEIAQAQKAVNMVTPPQYQKHQTPPPPQHTNRNANLLSMLD